MIKERWNDPDFLIRKLKGFGISTENSETDADAHENMVEIDLKVWLPQTVTNVEDLKAAVAAALAKLEQDDQLMFYLQAKVACAHELLDMLEAGAVQKALMESREQGWGTSGGDPGEVH